MGIPVLAADHRLRRHTEFAAVVRTGYRARRDGLVIHLAARPVGPDQIDQTRAGFVIPRGVGTAVVRNTLRRRLRHLVRERMGHVPNYCDLVIRAEPTSATRSYRELGQDLDAALGTVVTAMRDRAAGRRHLRM